MNTSDKHLSESCLVDIWYYNINFCLFIIYASPNIYINLVLF
jgi:hypothetical protein